MAETWHSPRYWQEQYHRQTVIAFDNLIDLALDGVVTMDQAIAACYETLTTPADSQHSEEAA